MSIAIIDYEPRYAVAFRKLNEEWISANFVLEEHDRVLLNDPDGYIIAKGGKILVALDDGEPVGVCALVRHNTDEYELSKFAVSPSMRGKGIGRKLGLAAIRLAKQLGGKTLFLEGNTKMSASISLYRRLGFAETTERTSSYCRCNIIMQMSVA
jgi:ribosomal protein S18 acetylase RimI-like enzyme